MIRDYAPARKINVSRVVDRFVTQTRLIKFDERRIMYLILVDRYSYIVPC